ncbi:lytic transglycosylase [Pseudomonas sp. 58 R 12]|uniref:lytic transglycosylase n=1 Tax=Pseudomonas sp. 58 R 12 TaxID=1844107 RepID=UPI00081C2340|nr:lytic transglycosylase [Pseudomonas sp. 58 R 12]
MVMPVFYSKSWFRAKKCAIEPMSESTARSEHQAGKSYTALIGSESTPSCFVEMLIDKGMVGVGFLDDKGHEYLTYQFHYLDESQLFLSMATHREFEGGKVAFGTTYIFGRQGGLVVRRERMIPYTVEDAQSTFEPAGNYEVAPKFGDYSGVININR